MFTTKKYMHKVAFMLGAYVVLLAIVFPFFVNSSLPSSLISMLIIAVGLASFFEYFIGIPYRILLQADQKNYIENILASISCVAYTIIAILLIRSDYSLVTVKTSSALISLSVMIIICLYAKKTYRLYEYNKKDSIPLPLRRDAAIHSIANIIHQNSDIVILTLFTNSKIVSVYTVYYFVAGQIKKLMGSFTDGLESAFGNIWAKKESLLLRERFNQYEFIIFFIVVIVFGCTASLLIPFVTLYTKGITDVDYIRPRFALFMVLTEMVYCMRQPYVTIVQAAGKYRDTRFIAVVEAVVNLSVSIIFVWKLGLIGVMIGTLSANLIRTIYYIWYSYSKLICHDIKSIILRILWFLLTFGAILLSSRYLMRGVVFTSWIQWVKWGCVLALLSTTITVLSSVFAQNRVLFSTLNTFKNGLKNR